MTETIDMIGRKGGSLTIIKRSGSDKNGMAMWLCRCECGNETIVNGQHLRNGNTKSCGCSRKKSAKKRRLGFGIAGMRQKIVSYKNSARIRGHKYNLTEKQFIEITKSNCYYCGIRPNNVAKAHYNSGNYIYNGLDRIDNSKGYTMSNIVPCCKICNQAKHTLTLEKFKDWIKKVYNNMENKL